MKIPYILNIDTATDICSVALSHGEQIIAYRENLNGKSHAQTLLPFIRDVLNEGHVSVGQLNAVALSKGPGSYTGLRIGTSTVKGICYAMGLPLIAIPTLQIIAVDAVNEAKQYPDGLICPLLDARRMEVFTAFYQNDLTEISPVHACIVDEESFTDILLNNHVVFCGNGVKKCAPILAQSPHAHFISEPISARNMAQIAFSKFLNLQFEDVAYFEPFYLKEYVAARSQVKGLQ
ncbi:MAG: tRNA (adenosine(37)-N6)-threonylcarbamoyltransferase complex dimerization subunit type 1 TsaB [Bacteroidales bacterium]|jgi:tRNA threonylcarbamoyladenosine biosynthesis protein TsaB|nr:tRNA (adenosine(37)-N6)-threonylcarbamoyltransferase complex dimerization subunit type 1 TsaB [Bacteroidales bacterium]MDD4395102.1 tRNA (adenosine(37)-N6)-threonylcarbamoyltransferase complex dimerization subunit type 1 TsaB [Bacteroidales bacterium]